MVMGKNQRYDGICGEVYRGTDRKMAKGILGGFVGAFLGGVIAISGAAYEMGRLSGDRENSINKSKEPNLEYDVDGVLAPIALGVSMVGLSFVASVVYGTRTLIDHVHECNKITGEQEKGEGI